MKKLFILTSICALLASCASCNQSDNTKKLLRAYHEYYVHTETLLDSIYISNPNKFDDVISETDAYDDYISYKKMLDDRLAK